MRRQMALAGLVAPWIGFCYSEDTWKWGAAILRHPQCPWVGSLQSVLQLFSAPFCNTEEVEVVAWIHPATGGQLCRPPPSLWPWPTTTQQTC